jgi:hypothetical protein
VTLTDREECLPLLRDGANSNTALLDGRASVRALEKGGARASPSSPPSPYPYSPPYPRYTPSSGATRVLRASWVRHAPAR